MYVWYVRFTIFDTGKERMMACWWKKMSARFYHRRRCRCQGVCYIYKFAFFWFNVFMSVRLINLLACTEAGTHLLDMKYRFCILESIDFNQFSSIFGRLKFLLWLHYKFKLQFVLFFFNLKCCIDDQWTLLKNQFRLKIEIWIITLISFYNFVAPSYQIIVF